MHKYLAGTAGLGVGFLAAVLFAGNVLASNTHSINFNGSTQYLSIPNASQTGLNFAGDMTAEAWVKLASQPSGALVAIASKWDNDHLSYILGYIDDDGTKKLKMYATSDGTGGSLTSASITHTLNTNTWYHVAFVYTASAGNLEVFVNGTSVGSTTGLVTSIASTTAPFTVGATGEPGDFFPGKIDDLRMYNVARTATEIASDYDGEITGSESGLVAYWKFDNDLTDSTSNGNTLTNNNSATFSTDIGFGGAPVLKVRKTTDQLITSNASVQDDNELVVASLQADNSYIIDGTLFVTSSSTPDIVLEVTAPSGATVTLGYDSGRDQGVLNAGTASNRIVIPAGDHVPVHISGTAQLGGTSGNLQLKWAQGVSSSNATAVQAGSYLRADQI